MEPMNSRPKRSRKQIFSYKDESSDEETGSLAVATTHKKRQRREYAHHDNGPSAQGHHDDDRSVQGAKRMYENETRITAVKDNRLLLPIISPRPSSAKPSLKADFIISSCTTKINTIK